MTTKRRYKIDISEAVHSSVAMLHNVEALDKAKPLCVISMRDIWW